MSAPASREGGLTKENLDRLDKQVLSPPRMAARVVPASPADFPTNLLLTIDRAENLAPRDLGKKSDPYVTIAMGNQPPQPNACTDYVNNTLAPIWGHSFKLHGVSAEISTITFTVWDHDRLSKDDFLGEAKWVINKPELRIDSKVALDLGCRADNEEDCKLMKKHHTLGRLIITARWR
eukprot:TRINITY_DN31333_c0_g1_i1.p1 TRINITY_DN31333_c0_g1~~TRINITY_DN31333_c0_g1_i1.p1  ORF type:complete len:178 (-),score=3.88 TRINITY_DN31333_c0_g1_i1:700-1233(-)